MKKLSGKSYHPDTIKSILQSLGFSMERETMDTLTVGVPFNKPDISLPADIVEEILRIDGLDSVEIPTNINISPSVEEDYREEKLKEKISNVLSGLGYTEILTNSITNAAYFTDEELRTAVRLLNNLSTELNIMRPSMLPTALEVLAFNLNRKNNNLKLFEFGKTYSTSATGKYTEKAHLSLYLTGQIGDASWKNKSSPADFYYLKGVVVSLLTALGLKQITSQKADGPEWEAGLQYSAGGHVLAVSGKVKQNLVSRFDIKQPVFFADIDWEAVLLHSIQNIRFQDLPKYPLVERDLAQI